MIALFCRVTASGLLFLVLAPAQIAVSKPPDADQQGEMLNKMSQYGDAYAANVPNFICTQVTTHFSSGLKHLKWSKGDTVVAQLSYSGGKEQQKIELVNNKVPKTEFRSWHWKLTTAGEFGNELYNVFAESSKAGYSWDRWDTLRNHPVAVFDYTIRKENSTMTLSTLGVKAVVPYKGSIWADPSTGQIWRIDHHALEIPSELQMEEIGTFIDYEPITIAGQTYILPVHAETVEKDHTEYKKNEADFKDYQQFRADSTLRFDVPDEPKK